MTVDCSFRKLSAQFGDEPSKRSLLCQSASVLWTLAVGSAAAYVANAYRVGVVFKTVRPNLLNGSALVNRAVKVYHKVIADAFPAPLPVPVVDVRHSEGLSFGSGGTMNDNFVDVSHFCLYL